MVIVLLTLAYVIVSHKMLGQVQEQGKIARESADAALLNARAVINAERARLAVELKLSPFLGNVTVREDKMIAHINVRCTNIGRTPAWIFGVIADIQLVDIIPDAPFFSLQGEGKPTPQYLPVGDSISEQFSLLCEGAWTLDKDILIHGEAQFRDVYDKEGSSTFGYTLSPDLKNLYRVVDVAAYNRNTYED